MAWLAKSLEKANYLIPVIQQIKQAYQQDQQVKGYEQLANLLNKAKSGVELPYSSQGIEPERMSYEPGGKLSSLTKPITRNQEPTIPIEEPGDFILGDMGANITGSPQDYKKADKESLQAIAEFYLQSIQNPNIDPSKIQQGIQGLDMMRGINKQQSPELEKLSKGQKIGYLDNTGKWVDVAKNEEAPDNPMDKKIDEYVSKDGKRILVFQKPNGDTYEKTFGDVRDTRSNTNINLPKEDKWQKFSDLVTKIQNPIATVEKKDPKTGETIVVTEKLTPEEIKRDKDKLYNSAVANMVPSAIQWYNQKVKDEWGREDMSEADYYAEIEQAVDEGEITDKETVQDLLDLGAFRRYIFNLDKKSYKAKQ